MEPMKAGMLAISKAGHDKGKVFVITKVVGEYGWIADGESRRVETPKRKNLLHLQPIRTIIAAPIDNEKVKKAIMAYRRF